MKTYNIYSARLHYHEFNKLIGTKKAESIDYLKTQIQKPVSFGGLNLNPFYAVIVDITDGAKIIEHNKHLGFCEKKVTE